jgi:hypothetical protein
MMHHEVLCLLSQDDDKIDEEHESVSEAQEELEEVCISISISLST